MTERLRVGILGAGWAAQSHATAFLRDPAVTVTSLWNRTRTRADEMAANLAGQEISVYDSWQELIDAGNIDILSIACAQQLRAEPVLAAFARGMHVLVEKPLSFTVADAQAMVDAHEKAGTVAAVCLSNRYAPGILTARDALRQGGIGRIQRIRSTWYLGTSPAAALERFPWWTDETAGLTGIGSHEFDRVHYLTDAEYTSLTGRVQSAQFAAAPDKILHATYTLIADLTGDITAELCSAATPGDGRWEVNVHGEAGRLWANNEAVHLHMGGATSPEELTIPDAHSLEPGVTLFQHCWNRLIDDFVAAIRAGDPQHRTVPILPTLRDGLRTQVLAAAAQEAETTRRWADVGTE